MICSRFHSLAILIFILVFPVGAAAQTSSFSSGVGQVSSPEILPEGPKGRYTLDQASVFALDYISGEIVDSGLYRRNNRVIYYFKIAQGDGSIFLVDVNSLNGEILHTGVESLGYHPRLPDNMIPADTAKMFAESYVREKTRGRLATVVESVETAQRDKRLVYVVRVKKGSRGYAAFVDAFTGDVLANEEVR